mmetsp:Transcript_96767/g.269043  ORF Transcript_96767/g.269043 Transcript_96767/m.269043 type:complete len:309 (+) Transcript_96767:408-1334(+)
MVMLSPPRPPVVVRSGETQASSRPSVTACGLRLPSSRAPNRGRMKSTACWLLMTSQTPSQATTMNSSPGCRWKVRTSGVQQMICSCGARLKFCLYRRSPIARERLKSPLTRYNRPWGHRCSIMQPPALRILAISPGRLGLWSSDMSMALPPRESTARQSPALATVMASGRTQQTMAVQPTKSACTGSTLGAPIDGNVNERSSDKFLGSDSISSMLWKEVVRAVGRSSPGCRASSCGRCTSQKRATCSPPWPSKTPKTAVSRQPCRWGMARWASSMRSLHPCMQLTPHRSPSVGDQPLLDFLSVMGPVQ